MSPESTTRTLILSDVHLGRPRGARSAAALEPVVASFDRVIVNGDVAELEHARYRDGAMREFDRFVDMCVAQAIRLDLIAGNHDPNVSEVRAMSLADGAVYVTHGDAFHPSLAPWSPCSGSMRRTFLQALARMPGHLAEDAARFAAAREAAVTEWRVMGQSAHISTVSSMLVRPHRLAAVLHYWSRFPALAARWGQCFAPEAGTVIVGHSHRAFVANLGGLRVVNTGAFSFPGIPHGVVLEAGEIRVHRILDDGARYRLAPSPTHVFPAERAERPRQGEAGGEAPSSSAARMNRPAFARDVRSTPAS